MFTRKIFNYILYFGLIIFTISCDKTNVKTENMESIKIILLHHSTGDRIWRGGVNKYMYKISKTGYISKWFTKYNATNKVDYKITEQVFPKGNPYPWNNYPYDYYNIWVKNADENPYMEEPTLEILTKKYDVISFKHCFPVSNIPDDTTSGNINSSKKTIENYKLQYSALKDKLLSFPDTKFIVWTGAALVKNKTNEVEAKMADEFFRWVINEWDVKGDNIFIWDFRELQTEGGLYFKNKYASSPFDSHPGGKFSRYAAELFCNRMANIINNKGDSSSLTGK